MRRICNVYIRYTCSHLKTLFLLEKIQFIRFNESTPIMPTKSKIREKAFSHISISMVVNCLSIYLTFRCFLRYFNFLVRACMDNMRVSGFVFAENKKETNKRKQQFGKE